MIRMIKNNHLSNKNHVNDAEAIAEAVQWRNMRCFTEVD
jgi:aspartate carbamoyltransferase regulatory subunit